MAILNTGYTWADAAQVTSTRLNNTVNNATFAADAVDDVGVALSNGKLALKDNGVTTAKIATDAVTPAKIDRDAGEYFLDDVTASTAKLTPFAVAQASSTMSLDLDNGNFQIITLSTGVTTVNALANMESGKQFTFLVVASGANAIGSGATWDSTWKWQGGAQVATTGTDGAVDIISGVTDGTNAYITMVKNFS